jgi:hypothetical protein
MKIKKVNACLSLVKLGRIEPTMVFLRDLDPVALSVRSDKITVMWHKIANGCRT